MEGNDNLTLDKLLTLFDDRKNILKYMLINILFKNEVFLHLRSVRPSVRLYETVISFLLVSAC